jgi:hypothetical protein
MSNVSKRANAFVKLAFGADPIPPTPLQPTHLVIEVGSSSVKGAAGAQTLDGKPKIVFSSAVALPTSRSIPVEEKADAFKAGVNTLAQQLKAQFPQVNVADMQVSTVATGPFRLPAFMHEVGNLFNTALQTIDPRLTLNPITGRQEGTYYFRSAHQGFLTKHPEATLPGTRLLGMDMGGFSTELVLGVVPPNGHSPKHHLPAVAPQRVVSVDLGRFNHVNGNQSDSFDYAALKAITQGVKRQVLAAMTQDKQHWWEYLPFIGQRLALRAYQHPDFMFSGSSALRKDFSPLIQEDYGVTLDNRPLSQAMIKHYLASPQAVEQLEAHAQRMSKAAEAKGATFNKFGSLGTELALVEGILEATKVQALYVSGYGNVRNGALLTQLDVASAGRPQQAAVATLA